MLMIVALVPVPPPVIQPPVYAGPPIVVPPPAPHRPVAGVRSAIPMRRLSTLITADDYPQAAIDRRDQGLVEARLGISPAGRVTYCMIVRSSGSVSLDQATCAIMTRRARFWPAQDRTGAPVNGVYNQRFRWELEALPFARFARTTRYAHDAAGTGTRCRGDDCDDEDFPYADVVALAGRSVAGRELNVERRLEPDTAAVPMRGPNRAPAGAAYYGRASVRVAANGKVTDCEPTNGVAGAQLCTLATKWLSALAPSAPDRIGMIELAITDRAMP